MELRSEKFYLRGWQMGDAQSLQQHANNINISKFLFDSFPFPYTIEEARRWIATHLNQAPLTILAIIIDEKACGAIEVKPGKDIYRKTGHMGYWLGEPFWGHGIMTEAVRLITNYAFERFDLVRIQSTVNDNNPASMRVLEKAGFVREAVMKKAIIKYGEIMDEHLFALLRP